MHSPHYIEENVREIYVRMCNSDSHGDNGVPKLTVTWAYKANRFIEFLGL